MAFAWSNFHLSCYFTINICNQCIAVVYDCNIFTLAFYLPAI